MQVGDLVREKTRMQRASMIGIVVAVDFTQKTGKLVHPYQVHFFDDGSAWGNGADWMREGFLEVINASR